jgi:hypothetical protein
VYARRRDQRRGERCCTNMVENPCRDRTSQSENPAEMQFCATDGAPARARPNLCGKNVPDPGTRPGAQQGFCSTRRDPAARRPCACRESRDVRRGKRPRPWPVRPRSAHLSLVAACILDTTTGGKTLSSSFGATTSVTIKNWSPSRDIGVCPGFAVVSWLTTTTRRSEI